MNNNLIPFDAEKFDPKKYRLCMHIPLRYMGNCGKAPYFICTESTTGDDYEHFFTRDGRYAEDQSTSLFMEPIEPEGEEEEDLWDAVHGLRKTDRIKALEKKHGELKLSQNILQYSYDGLMEKYELAEKQVLELKAANESLLKTANHWIGVAASHSQPPTPPPPAPVPFSMEKYKEGWTVQTRGGKSVEQIHSFSICIDGYSLAGVVEGELETWMLDGRCLASQNEDNGDLVLLPPAPVEEVRYFPIPLTYFSLEKAKELYPGHEQFIKGIFHDNKCVKVEPIQ